jgi:hypothetical protein
MEKKYQRKSGEKKMPKRKLRVYIAGPMTGGTKGFFNMKKIHEAIEVYFQLIRLGYVPHCPHLTVFCEFMKPNQVSYEQWLELDKNYIDDSDVVLRIPGTSPGADRECTYARGKGMSVYDGIHALLSRPLNQKVTT